MLTEQIPGTERHRLARLHDGSKMRADAEPAAGQNDVGEVCSLRYAERRERGTGRRAGQLYRRKVEVAPQFDLGACHVESGADGHAIRQSKAAVG
jgi:hypothetical protein